MTSSVGIASCVLNDLLLTDLALVTDGALAGLQG